MFTGKLPLQIHRMKPLRFYPQEHKPQFMTTDKTQITHGSLFSGIGGFDLAAEWKGWENKFHCEIDPFPRKILNHYWPNAKSYEDIRKTDFTIWRGRIDVLTGGFPCQPYSNAGKRMGNEDERHLWPEMLRAIQEISPRWVVGENVDGIVNWNGGLVFDEIQTDLEDRGYKVQPIILPAAGINAPHRRNRVWFIAYSESQRSEWIESELGKVGPKEKREYRGSGSGMGYGIDPDTNRANEQQSPPSGGQKRKPSSDNKSKVVRQGNGETDSKGVERGDQLFSTHTTSIRGNEDNGKGKSEFTHENGPGNFWRDFPTQPPQFVAEMMGFPPNWTVIPFQIGETNPSKDLETP